MRVFITGATGLIGTRLTSVLLDKGYFVATYGRTPVSHTTFFKGDIRDRSTLETAITSFNPDIVFHLAAVLDERDPALFSVNVDGTENIATILSNHNTPLIYLSSLGILSNKTLPIKETAPYAPKTKYERSKMLAELKIKESKVRYIILRSTMVLYPGKEWFLFSKLIEKHFPLPGTGKNHFHLISIEDVVSALLFSANLTLEHNYIFNLAGPDVYTLDQTVRMFAKHLNVSPPPHISKVVAKFFFPFFSFKISPSLIDRLTWDRWADISLLKNHGFTPTRSIRSEIKSVVDAYHNE